MRGSSGAAFEEVGDSIIKSDTDITGTRVRDQGVWLRQHDESELLPAIRAVHSDRYEMETLRVYQLPTTWKELFDTCEEIIGELETNLWDYAFESTVPRLVSPDEYEHKIYITELLRDVHLSRRFRTTLHGFARTINWHSLTAGRTHGDCIIDNVAYRVVAARSRQLVLLDPIPACPALPDVVALDVGRVIQSAAGYEVARYPIGGPKEIYAVPLVDRVDAVLNTWLNTKFDINEVRAALHFSVIHMLRGLRSAQRVAPECITLINNLVTDLVEVTEKWMR